VLAGKLRHDDVFFKDNDEPIRNLNDPYDRWSWTLRKLQARYREPYAARHSSVSWNFGRGTKDVGTHAELLQALTRNTRSTCRLVDMIDFCTARRSSIDGPWTHCSQFPDCLAKLGRGQL
jgi:hypothetical protein